MNNTKERPIVLTAQEVNSVLAGNKTQHRVPVLTSEQVATGYKCCYGVASGQVIFTKNESDKSFVDDGYISVKCPLGSIGDRLWVQEDHRPISWAFEDGEVTIEYRDGKRLHPHYLTEEELETNPNDDYPFAVVEELLARNVPILKDRDCFDFSNPDNLPHWRSADVMPKFASRLLLEITDVRIERIQDISDIDARAMGLKPDYCDHKYQSCKDIGCIGKWAEPLMNYFIHEKNIANVSSRDWVWVIEFKVVEPSEVVDG